MSIPCRSVFSPEFHQFVSIISVTQPLIYNIHNTLFGFTYDSNGSVHRTHILENILWSIFFFSVFIFPSTVCIYVAYAFILCIKSITTDDFSVPFLIKLALRPAARTQIDFETSFARKSQQARSLMEYTTNPHPRPKRRCKM